MFEAGVALFNAGHALAARDRWQSARIASVADADVAGADVAGADAADVADADVADADFAGADAAVADTEPADQRLRRGLVAVATTADHARNGDRSAVVDHATRALRLLDGLDEESRGIELELVREWCRRLADDPEATVADPEAAAVDLPSLRIDGTAVEFEDLDLTATLSAAPALAAAVDAGDEETMSAAVVLAREERGTGRTEVTELVFAYLRRPEARPQIAARIADHVDRDRRKRRDVSSLFE
ncbi:DUF309 domain-containing protein [Halorubrum sp. 48-1-W]|nr:DUF309 domain-containing protein [Halorubrum sp. 48-1-W]